MDWYFIPDYTGAFSRKDATTYTVSSQGTLTHLEIFVREVLQNALDNGDGTVSVKVRFRPVVLTGADKQNFLTALKFESLRSHLQASFADIQSGPDQHDVTGLLDPAEPLPLLYIEDYGTRGLIGPETNLEAHLKPEMYPRPHCFLGLCRNIGDSQKSDTASGGTYGFGKSVLWKNSNTNTVVVYSRLSVPYMPAEGECVDQRLFGQVRLPSHWIGTDSFREGGYFGERQTGEEIVTSIRNGSAEQIAGRLGFELRSAAMPGTSILIVDMLYPDTGERASNAAQFAIEIKAAAEKFFWPAIADGRLSVQVTYPASGHSNSEDADPASRTSLSAFMPAYAAAKNNTPALNVELRTFPVEIPKGPGPEELGTKAKICVATVTPPGNGEMDEYRNRAALIRGAGMVVGYVPVHRRSFAARDFYAVVLGGRAFPNPDQGGDFAQRRCEKLLALAEPVTHDKWTERSDQLRGWRAASARIKDIINGFSKSIADLTSEVVPPEGDAAPELARLFPFLDADEVEHERDMTLEVIEPGRRSRIPDSEFVNYEFEIRLRIPPRKKFAGRGKPDRWRITSRFAFLSDSKSPRPIGTLRARFTALNRNGSWEQVPGDFDTNARFEDDVREVETICSLRGETERISIETDSLYRYALLTDTAKFVSAGGALK